jgi:hypothetical protein
VLNAPYHQGVDQLTRLRSAVSQGTFIFTPTCNSLRWDNLHFVCVQRSTSNQFFSHDIDGRHPIVVPRKNICPSSQECLDASKVESLARYVQRSATRLKLWQLSKEHLCYFLLTVELYCEFIAGALLSVNLLFSSTYWVLWERRVDTQGSPYVNEIDKNKTSTHLRQMSKMGFVIK